MTAQTQHWIVKVIDTRQSPYEEIQSSYFDGTRAQATKYFKTLKPVAAYWGKPGYYISMQPNPITLWDGYQYNPSHKKTTRRKKVTRRKNPRKNKYRIWKVVNGETTGLATSNEFSTQAYAKKYCKEKLDKRGTYAVVNSRLTSVGVNKALLGKA